MVTTTDAATEDWSALADVEVARDGNVSAEETVALLRRARYAAEQIVELSGVDAVITQVELLGDDRVELAVRLYGVKGVEY